MAKLSDGSSFKFFRVKDNFLTVKATADSALPWVDRIQENGFNLFHAHGRVTIPPVFHDKWIYLYTTVSGNGSLRAFYYNSARMEMDLVCTETFLETSALYHQYSLVKVGAAGFLFHVPGAADTTLYFCDSASNVETWPRTFTKTVVTYDFAACMAAPTNCGPQAATAPPIYCGGASAATANVVLRQARDDPGTYAYYQALVPPEIYPPIWAYFTNEYFLKLTFSGSTFTVAKSIYLPKELNLLGRTAAVQGTLYAEQLDVGHQFLAIMSPTQAGAKYAVDSITSPSVCYYDLSKDDKHDVINCDCAYLNVPDGLEDNSGCTEVWVDPLAIPLVQQVNAVTGWKVYSGGAAYTTPTVFPWAPWYCVNLAHPVETGTLAWQLT